jgi:hypothetical protein
MKINTDSLFMVNCTMQDHCLLNKEYRKPTNTYLYVTLPSGKQSMSCMSLHIGLKSSATRSLHAAIYLLYRYFHDSDHSTKCHAVNSHQPKVRPSQDNSQWHPSFPLFRTLSAKSAKQYPRITSRQYALHPEKSVAVFIP